MSKHILVIQGHPDPAGGHYGHAIADSYGKGAREAGLETRLIEVAGLDFPLLRTREEFEKGELLPCIKAAQQDVSWADHLVIIYPLWLGFMPAVLKGFFEQVFRYGFAIDTSDENAMPKKLLTGKSARIVVTMGMPALVYRWYFGAHSLKGLERNILGLCGIKPVRESLIGMVDAKDDKKRIKWLDRMHDLGRRGR